MVILRATSVAFQYPGPVRALDGVDLSLAEGELLCVIGPNGSGKSTLVRCLAGLESPEEGGVILGGRSIADLPPRERAKALAVVPQYLPALPDVRVLDFVLGGRYAWFRGWRGPGDADVEIAEEALREADASDVARRLMGELSGGQRQRVLIARALAQQARVVLVDEPTTALDPEHQVRVFELLSRLARSERAVLVVTHDLNLASQFAGRVVLLDEGRVVAEGEPKDVLRREVLVPVYGDRLHFGQIRGADGMVRPVVIPWRGE